MVKRSSNKWGSLNDEFPLLDELGLYASSTTGDGNCLFRAVSDQVHGNEGSYAEFRKRAVEYLKEHSDHFAAFIGEFGESFEQYIKRMSRDGVYGGHLELVAISNFYNIEIAIYQAEHMYIVHPTTNESTAKKRVHIAYHSWEHYSSVRSKSDRGLPKDVVIDNITLSGVQKALSDDDSSVPRWKVEIVLRSVPDAPEDEVVEMLKSKEYGDVIEELLTRQLEEEVASAITTTEHPNPNKVDAADDEQATNGGVEEPDTSRTPAKKERTSHAKKSGEKKLHKRLTPAERREARKERLAAKKNRRTASSEQSAAATEPTSKTTGDDKVSVKVIHI